MSKFTELVTQDTPRLVVMFKRPAPGQEQYQWGMVGRIPLLSLIGHLGRVQAELALLEPGDPRFDIPESALCLAFVRGSQQPEDWCFQWWVHQDIPRDSLAGMLETIKAALVDSQMAQQARNQQVGLLGPDGSPMRRRP